MGDLIVSIPGRYLLPYFAKKMLHSHVRLYHRVVIIAICYTDIKPGWLVFLQSQVILYNRVVIIAICYTDIKSGWLKGSYNRR